MRRSGSTIHLAAGMALGGLVVGASEGLYREAGLLYPAFLYGALWSCAGLGLSLATAVLWRPRSTGPLFGLGFGLAISVSALVLVRFIALRDFLDENPNAGMLATLYGLGMAIVCAMLLFAFFRALGRIFHTPPSPRALSWTCVLVPLTIFGLMTQRGDDTLPAPSPVASRDVGDSRGTILLVVDTLRADAISPYGAPRESSPNLHAFSEVGTVFEDVTAQASWTRPAVASLLTSKHPSGHQTMSKASILPDSLLTLAEAMKEAGRKTAAVVTNYNLEAGYGFSQGFDQYRYLAPARYLGAPKRANRLAAYNVFRLLREKLITTGREARFFYRDGRTVNTVGLELLDQIVDQDFFLYLHYMEPHDPYFGEDGSYARVSQVNPPASMRNQIQTAYAQEVHRWDRIFGEFLDEIKARGLLDRVDIIVTADHGEEFLDHGGWWHGETLYQEQVHIPLLAAGPSFPPAVIMTLSRQIDIAPTLLASIGAETPKTWEGLNLLDPSFQTETALAEENHNGNDLKSIRQGTRKLILANPNNPRGLGVREHYDLERDPEEATPLDTKGDLALDQLLAEQLQEAREGAARARQREISPEQEAELRALGYVQ